MILNANEPTARGNGRSPSLAAFLSFVWPGLGQLYVGKRRAAAIFAVPAVLVLLLLVYGLQRGVVVFAAQLFADRNVGIAAIAILILLGVWRLVAVVHAFLGGQPRESRRVVDRGILAVLAVLIVVSHLGGGYYLLAYSDAGTQVFNPNNPDLIDQPSLAPGETAQPSQSLSSRPRRDAL
jgi:TM2 domain-containing membrane protein YozV